MKKQNKPPFCKKIDISLAPKLKKDLENQGFSFSSPNHSLFSAKKKGVVCTLYKSGSLVIQGKEKDEFIEFYIEPELLKTFEYTHPEAHTDMTSRIGVDESGKGDFFGPLCVAGIYADKEQIKKLIKMHVKDSKRMSDTTILKIAKQLRKDFDYSVICISPQKYNELYSKMKNLNTLLGWGHSKVIYNVVQKTSCKNVIIDQFANESVVESAIKRQNISVKLTQRHKGESDIVVAAASILARASFVENLEKLQEQINLILPKGASTKTKETGLKIATKLGEKALSNYAKIHFKTYKEILEKLRNV